MPGSLMKTCPSLRLGLLVLALENSAGTISYCSVTFKIKGITFYFPGDRGTGDNERLGVQRAPFFLIYLPF